MLNFIDKIDFGISNFLFHNVKNKKLDFILGRINRGEIFFLIFLYICYKHAMSLKEFGILCLHLAIVTTFSEKFVLYVKRKIQRVRPGNRVMKKEDPNPDMNNSFPSAHAANSMTAISLMVFIYSFPIELFWFSFFAGFARLLTLHHFLSDIVSGWLFGLFLGILNYMVYLEMTKKNIHLF